MSPLLFLAPLWMIFEVWQLVISERYLGIRQIETGTDPRTLGIGQACAAFWSLGIFAEWLWMMALLLERFGRAQGLCMLAVTCLGFFLRRASGIRWTLVILTFEGAIRIGMMLSLCGMAWRRFML